MAASSDAKADGPVEYIKLESADGHVFVVDQEAACASATIAALFSPEIREMTLASGKPIRFGEIGTAILEKVCQYFYYKKKYSKVVTEKIPDFDIPPKIALELLMAANFLDC
jgi:elongin-C